MSRKTFHMERNVRKEGALGIFEPKAMHVRAETELEAAELFGIRMRAIGYETYHGWRVLQVIDPDKEEP